MPQGLYTATSNRVAADHAFSSATKALVQIPNQLPSLNLGEIRQQASVALVHADDFPQQLSGTDLARDTIAVTAILDPGFWAIDHPELLTIPDLPIPIFVRSATQIVGAYRIKTSP